MPKYLSITELGVRLWEADDIGHAKEQHIDAGLELPVSVKPYHGFNAGDRVFSHYSMKWGNIEELGDIKQIRRQGEPTGDYDAWHGVKWDDGSTDLMNDGGTVNWDHGRIVPPAIAKRYGYGEDPKA